MGQKNPGNGMAGKVAIVTGGASGLGRVIVARLVEEGANVCFTYRNSAEKAKALCEKYGEKVLAVRADASDYSDAEGVVRSTVSSFGKIDILINNAASARDGSLKKLSPDDFEYTLKNVLFPAYNYCHAAVGELCRSHGKIVNISSINGLRGREGSLAYSAAKGGVIGLTKTIAKELGDDGVCCNTVAPGFIATDGQEKTSELIKKLVLSECAIRHLTQPEEVAELVLFLAGSRGDSITGQVYQIDCGQYI